MHGFRAPLLALVLTVLVAGCAGSPGQESSSSKKRIRVENPALGLAIGAILPSLDLVTNEGETLRLKHKEGEGEIWLEVSTPEVGGLNLVAMVQQSKVAYESLEEGKFYGQAELGTQFGSAYTVRGSFARDGEAVEERRIFSLHPDGRQIITMIYAYPTGNNSRARTNEMLELFSELESLDFQSDGA